MSEVRQYDAAVVGAGPNGLAAAIELARQGLSVVLYEGAEEVGGGLRSAELTEPGFTHDLCSSIHPLAVGSPFISSLPLQQYGLEWIYPPVAYAHPLDDGRAAVSLRDLDETAERLGIDSRAYRGLYGSAARRWDTLVEEILRPLLHMPSSPLVLAGFGIRSLPPADLLARTIFRTEAARALLAGVAAHSLISLRAPGSAAVAMMLGASAHAVGWPMPSGGAGRLAAAMSQYFSDLGGTVVLDRFITDLEQVPARLILLDVTPRQFLSMTGDRLPPRYRRVMQRYRYGPGAFKIDYALSEPVPWAAAECARAGTIHLGGTLGEIVEAEHEVMRGRIPDSPYVLAAQHTPFDPTRAPAGKHTLWAYCHVPNGSEVDMTERIERQIERFAPGFRDVVLARHVEGPAALEQRNPNLVGGDINGGSADLLQLVKRPILHPAPYRTPIAGVYLCSSSTPPGGGVHGMCGFNAARQALRDAALV